MIFFRIAGVFLIIVPVLYLLGFFALGRAFAYPGILRQPADDVLRRFAAGGARLVAIWYGFAVSAVLVIPMALFFQLVFVDQHRYLATSAAVVGALGGLAQAMSLLCWVFVVPGLARQYTTADAASHDTVALVFRVVRQFAGIGAHLGFLLTGVWTLLMSSMMASTPAFGPSQAGLGIVAAVGILAGLLIPTGWKPAVALNAAGMIGWAAWLLVSGASLLLQ